MIKRELEQKLRSDLPLTAGDMALLEEALADGQTASLLQGMPEEVPSLAWRSELNEKLRAVQPIPAKAKISWWKVITGGSLALGVASSVALVLVLQKNAELNSAAGYKTQDVSIEAQLLTAHQESVSQLEFGGSTRHASKASSTTKEFKWSDADLESL